ncbi:hypothetical protein BD779DRAFT_1782795 [Infundibulicybe gibba]|nr:hypothetical protein BD779DRAFT_1782795 [Infundibulicybe gibba]
MIQITHCLPHWQLQNIYFCGRYSKQHKSQVKLDTGGILPLTSTFNIPIDSMAAPDTLDTGLWRTFLFALLVCSFALACTLILTVLLSKHLRRLKTWILFISSIIIFCLTFMILPVSGYGGNVSPPFALCLIQASLVKAASPLVLFAAACFMAEVYYMIHISLRHQPHHHWVRLLLLLPPLVHLVIFSFAIWIGAHNPARVIAPSATEAGIVRCCHVASIALSYSVVLSTAVFGLGMAVASAYIAILLYSNWRDYGELNRQSGRQAKENPSTFSFSVLVRLALFSILAVVSTWYFPHRMPYLECHSPFTSLDLLSGKGWASVNGGVLVWDAMLMILPLAAVLLFGTQQDILHTWASWLRVSMWSVYPKLRRTTLSGGIANLFSPATERSVWIRLLSFEIGCGATRRGAEVLHLAFFVDALSVPGRGESTANMSSFRVFHLSFRVPRARLDPFRIAGVANQECRLRIQIRSHLEDSLDRFMRPVFSCHRAPLIAGLPAWTIAHNYGHVWSGFGSDRTSLDLDTIKGTSARSWGKWRFRVTVSGDVMVLCPSGRSSI